MTGVLVRKGNLDTQRDTSTVCIHRKEHSEDTVKQAIGRPRRRASEETKLADTLILNF